MRSGAITQTSNQADKHRRQVTSIDKKRLGLQLELLAKITRMALGADRREITGMFLRHGLMLSGIGVACGLAAAFAVVRVMSSLLFKVSSVDLVTYGTMSLSLFLTTLVASYLPSRRAASVDPAEALRAE